MLPQKPPQPSCSYLPLKLLSVGIQTSKLMIESVVGVAVPATRQNCGRPVFEVQPVLPVAQPGGVLNVPPVMVCAAVICPRGNERFVRPSQAVAADTAAALRSTAAADAVAAAIVFRRAFILSLPMFSFDRHSHARCRSSFLRIVLRFIRLLLAPVIGP